MKKITVEKNENLVLKDTITPCLSPAHIFLPIYHTSTLRIDPKEPIFKGQIIFDSIPSPVSGKILGITKCKTIHNHIQDCLLIENDYKEKYKEKKSVRKKINTLSKEELIKLTKEYNPNLAALFESSFSKIVIHSIEEQPYVGNFMYLNRSFAGDIMSMIDALGEILLISNITFVLKETDYESINSYNFVLGMYPTIEVKYVPDQYLLSEKEQIKEYLKLNEEFLYLNVEEVYDLYQFLKKRRYKDEKLITITGDAIENPQVIQCKLGTKIDEIIKEHIKLNTDDYILLSNSLLNGSIEDRNLIVTEQLKAIFIMKEKEIKESKCIRCGKCNEVCPVNIKVYNLVNNKQCSIEECIQCGLCSYVCPSLINIQKYLVGDQNE